MTQQTRPIDSRHEPQARPMVSPQYLGAVHDTLREMGYSPRNGMRWCATRTHSRNEFGVCGAMFGQMVRLLDVVCEFVIRRVSSFSTLFGYLVRGRSLAQWRRARSSRVRPRLLCVSEDYITPTRCNVVRPVLLTTTRWLWTAWTRLRGVRSFRSIPGIPFHTSK